MLTAVWVHGTGWGDRSSQSAELKRQTRLAALQASLAATGSREGINLSLARYAGPYLPSASGRLANRPVPSYGGSPPSGKIKCECCRDDRDRVGGFINKLGRKGKLDRLAPCFMESDALDYLQSPNTRERAAGTLAAQVPAGTDVLIGHSLGSIVALDVLARLDDTQRPRVLVTTGSPLRHHAFRDVAREEGLAQWSRKHRSTPWINVYDKADPSTKGTKLKTEDLGPLIQIAVDNKAVGSSHHSGSAHLQHPAVARAILNVTPG